MKTKTPLLIADNLTCIREERILFENLSFEVTPGSIVQIEGQNGAGKTSLLRILSGLSTPYAGQILHLGENIKKYAESYHQNLTYIGHISGVKSELTAQENLSYYLDMHGENPDEAENTLTKVNLTAFEDSLASHLSAGQHRRIALARLWQNKTKIWILDEPFTAIDKEGVKNLEALFLQHCKNGGCVILTSHQDLLLPELPLRKIQLAYRFY